MMVSTTISDDERRSFFPLTIRTTLLFFLVLIGSTPTLTSCSSSSTATTVSSFQQPPSFTSASSSLSNTKNPPSPTNNIAALLLDVDNTLYTERHHGIEAQIVKNTHSFCQNHLGLSPEESDDLYRRYGSTAEGLRHSHPEVMEDFYKEVYEGIDVSSLFRDDGGEGLTGYSSSTTTSRLERLLNVIISHKKIPVYLVSNSPRCHVQKVIAALGLGRVPFADIITPDSHEDFITKSDPAVFYSAIKELTEMDAGEKKKEVWLLDDSKYNVQSARDTLGLKGIPITTGREGLEETLTDVVVVPPKDNFVFNDVSYLRAKNDVDAASLNTNVWHRLRTELGHLATRQERLCVADLGAGRLSMLRALLERDGVVRSFEKGVEYHAYESNENLVRECRTVLNELGFEELEGGADNDDGKRYRLIWDDNESSTTEMTVHLHTRDFRNYHPHTTPHLIIGCCFVDLFPPESLLRDIMTFCSSSSSSSTLLYFPITFNGVTVLNPPSPFCGQIPSDTLAMKYYADSLRDRGHSLSPSRLIHALEQRGGRLLARGTSPWVFDAAHHEELYDCFKYFFRSSGMVERMMEDGWDGERWWERFCASEPGIWVSNMDLLLRLGDGEDNEGDVGGDDGGSENTKGDSDHCYAGDVEEIEFVAPNAVRSRTVLWDRGEEGNKHLGDDQMEVQSLYSLISTGTELKIFRGQFSSSNQLDTTISSMSSQTMSYPLSYGYSLVGKVTAVGRNVPSSVIGKTVFSFSPHATHVIIDYSPTETLFVPQGVHPLDAVFFPSVETALSIVHDAHVRRGERVGVFGCGLIGSLVTSLLALSHVSRGGGGVTVYDALIERLALAAQCGATETLFPPRDAIGTSQKHDVTIEVSGHPAALQSAINTAKDGGRIIVASWYGDTMPVTLHLGMDFHRSHKTLITSQVSEIPSSLRKLWDKGRRFEAVWELLKVLKPRETLVTRVATEGLTEAQSVYDALSKGEEMCCVFRYSGGSERL